MDQGVILPSPDCNEQETWGCWKRDGMLLLVLLVDYLVVSSSWIRSRQPEQQQPQGSSCSSIKYYGSAAAVAQL